MIKGSNIGRPFEHSPFTLDLSPIYGPCHSRKSINRPLISLERRIEARREEEKRRKKLLLDHRQTFAGPPLVALAFVEQPLEALTSAGPPPNAVTSPDHHVRPSPPPDHRLTSLLRWTTT
ncbi:hypothetical protein MA16_Dca005437 [Dendrobium catenatum]|uniref:Uncharacterized protein n=1 Tax=Dendrobium catenatum TaxID=906689 RepID=A0A2I0X3E9_9ASPA|nr:hypothetical protein MA16_Dca005437 [Dendrobium catenatum]